MIDIVIAIFLVGMVYSFYLQNKKKIDKVRKNLEELVD